MTDNDTGFVFLTGATGLLGHYALRELVRRGRRCALLLREPISESMGRLSRLLEELGEDLAHHVAAGRIVPVAGTLWEELPGAVELKIDTILHSAATTSFREDAATGEPARTNVHGTRRLLDWAAAHGIQNVHLVSSAYACGVTDASVAESIHPRPARFHNAYEESKWQAEQLCDEWAKAHDAQLTIHRPSVVVGEWGSGRATKFGGFYLSARSTDFLDRAFAGKGPADRQNIALRLKGRPQDCQNIVPVDYVARMITEIVVDPVWHGGTYHIVHPLPPSNASIKRAFEEYFDIGGGRFVAPSDFPAGDLNEYERQFYDISRSIEHYFIDTPRFERANTERVEAKANIRCRAFDSAAIARLIAYAQAVNWGRRHRSRDGVPGCAKYFEHFLPQCVGDSKVAQMNAVKTTMRFVIEDEPDGEWVCAFDAGKLHLVHRGRNGVHEQFGYRSTREVFWEAISGHTHPQELFLSGRAEVFGDIERAMKMAMILHEFTREFPCNPAQLARFEEDSCKNS